jgi:diguanylate cyclase (GGDEF)-like protein
VPSKLPTVVLIHRKTGKRRRLQRLLALKSFRTVTHAEWSNSERTPVCAAADGILLGTSPGTRDCDLDTLRRLKDRMPNKPVIVITEEGDIATAKSALRAGAWDCLEESEDDTCLLADLLRILGRADRSQSASKDASRKAAPIPASEHRLFLDALAGHRALCRRMSEPLTIVMLDLDRFRECNLRHSTAFGDHVLAWFGEMLTRISRMSDLVTRYESDRFVVALPFAHGDQAVGFVERCRAYLRTHPVAWQGESYELSVTAGIVQSSFGFMETEHELIQRGRITLDHAKQSGPNSTATWAQVATSRSPCAGCLVAKAGGVNHWARRIREQIRQAYLESTQALVAAVEAKDPFCQRHSMTVSEYAEEIAKRLGIRPALRRTICTAALLHDVGKIGVPDAILTKPGPLTSQEYAVVKRHPETALAILGHISSLESELPLILHHHERHDGKGYPKGLEGGQIPIGASIIAVADAIDAMRSSRSYKRPYDRDHVRRELMTCSGTQFNPEVAKAALDWLVESTACGEAALPGQGQPCTLS